MSRKVSVVLMLTVVVTLQGKLFADRPEDFGEQWVRSNQFLITGWSNAVSGEFRYDCHWLADEHFVVTDAEKTGGN